MPKLLKNPWRGAGIEIDAPLPADDPKNVREMLAQCPAHAPTPLHNVPELAHRAGVAQVWVKDERTRMGLGSFKALGAAHAMARAAVDNANGDIQHSLSGHTFVAASAGNHGLSVAAGAKAFGARAVIYLANTVPEAFANRLKSYGAEVVRAGDDYEASMVAAEDAARAQGWTLLSDSSWGGYYELPQLVMEGYLQLAHEIADQIDEPPSHILLQAGVGGLAGAVAAFARHTWGDAPTIIVVEPEVAPALINSIREGTVVTTDGPVSSMGRLDCKTPSLIALAGLSRDADAFVTITEDEAKAGTAILAEHGLETTPSGGAGLATLLAGLDLGANARVLAILSEAPERG